MPELPEVETIRRGLEEYIVGNKIESVDVRLQRIVTGDKGSIVGGKIKAVRRAGKGLLIDLDNGYSIAVHIKLTGQLVYSEQGEEQGSRQSRGSYQGLPKLSPKVGGDLPNKFTHVTFNLDKNCKLHYNDIRQFGWIKIVKTNDVKTLPFFKELGPEPFNGLTLDKFCEIVSKSSTKIKPLLMDQKKIGGIGNIYANDGLWLAGIDPRRSSKSLTTDEQKKLYESILEVLKRGLKYGGASEINFVNALGQEGGYQKHFLAYAQNGKPCQCCGMVIQKIALGGRGTYFCKKCQR